MRLKTYIAETARRQELVKVTGLSGDYLWQIANGWRGRKPSYDLAVCIEQATAGAVRCEDLRPDVTWVRDQAGTVTGYTVPLPAHIAPTTEARAA